MARADFDHRDRYEILGDGAGTGVVRVFPARCRDTGAACRLHRADLEESGLDRQGVEVHLRRWGAVRSPNTAVLADAWFADEGAFWVDFPIEGPPLASGAARERLGKAPAGFERELARQSLAGLASLHEFDVSHRALGAESWVVGADGVVVLADWGLDARIEAAARERAGEGSSLALSTGFMARDVAVWACIVGEALLGRPLLGDRIASPDPIDREVLEEAAGALGAMEDNALAALIADGVRAFGSAAPRFESAVEAFKAFPGRPAQ